jgi:hypothetical protein
MAHGRCRPKTWLPIAAAVRKDTPPRRRTERMKRERFQSDLDRELAADKGWHLQELQDPGRTRAELVAPLGREQGHTRNWFRAASICLMAWAVYSPADRG